MRKCTWAEEEGNSGSIKYQSWVPVYHSRLVQSSLAFCQKHFGNDTSFCLVSCSTYFKADVLPPVSLAVAVHRLHILNACGSNFSWISNSPVHREVFCLLKMRILLKVMQHWCARLLLRWTSKLKDQFEFCHAWQFHISSSVRESSLWRKSTQREAEHARWILSQAQPPAGTVLLNQSQPEHHYLNVIFLHVIQAVTSSPPAASVVL